MQILYTVIGKVKQGNHQGKALGYPTANIPLQKKIPEGIYTSFVKVNGKVYNAVSFVGAAKTFNRKDRNVESYLFDFSEEIYGREMTVQLLSFLRGNRKFISAEDLVAQMKVDVADAKAFFSEQGL